MKKLSLVLAGILVLGATSLVADSVVDASANTNMNVVQDSEITDSTVGVSIDAEDSYVSAYGNTNSNSVTGGSTVVDSSVGLNVEAQSSDVYADFNIEDNEVDSSNIDNSSVGTTINAH